MPEETQRLKVWKHFSLMVPVLFRFAPVSVGSLGNACNWAFFTGIYSLWLNMLNCFVVFIPSGCCNKGHIGLFWHVGLLLDNPEFSFKFRKHSFHAIWSEYANERQVSICPIWSILIKLALGHVALHAEDWSRAAEISDFALTTSFRGSASDLANTALHKMKDAWI